MPITSKEVRRTSLLRALDEAQSMAMKADIIVSELTTASGDDPDGNLNIVSIKLSPASQKEINISEAESAIQLMVDLIITSRPITRDDLQSWWSEHIGRNYPFPG